MGSAPRLARTLARAGGARRHARSGLSPSCRRGRELDAVMLGEHRFAVATAMRTARRGPRRRPASRRSGRRAGDGRAASRRSQAGAFADLADACIVRSSAPPARARSGARPRSPAARAVVVAMGKCGREMTAGSDLDLILSTTPAAPRPRRRKAAGRPTTFYARLTQRLITALSPPDRRGRPLRGRHAAAAVRQPGPVATQLRASSRY